MFLQPEDVVLCLLKRSAGDHCASVVVHLQHQLFRPSATEAEELLEYEGHVRHEIDRIVPDDDLPRDISVLTEFGATDFGGRWR